jgi:hypothetical protein
MVSRRQASLDSSYKADSMLVQSPPILSAVFTPDGKRIALGTSKGDVLLVDKATRNIVQQVHTGSSGVKELSLDRSGRCVLLCLSRMIITFADWSYHSTAPWLQIPTIGSFVSFQSLPKRMMMEARQSASQHSIAFKTSLIERHGLELVSVPMGSMLLEVLHTR